MKANKIKITTLVDGSRQFKIPIYQRTYDWSDKQCNQLWEDIISIGESEKEEHFLGTIVYKEEGTQGAGETKKFLIIDGQQRITTVLLLIVALVRHVENNPDSPLSSKIPSIKSQFMTNDNKGDDERHKLVLTKNDRETLASIIDNREPPGDKSRRITDVFGFFQKKTREVESLETVINGISKLSFIDIILERDDDPQHIFESINSTGLKLAQTDLIRNFVFMKMSDSEQQNRIYRDYWAPMENNLDHRINKEYFDRFVRDYLTINLEEIPDKDKVYDRFKSHLESKDDVEGVIKEMSSLSGLYKQLLFPDCGPEETKEAITNINRLKSDVAYPFLLRIYSDLKEETVRMVDVVKIVRMIESYVFRRWMCSLPSNALNKIFARLSHEDMTDNYAGRVAILLTTMSGTGAFPDDDKFKSSFYVKEAYKSQPNLRYMLERLENHDHEEDGKLIIDKSITIEHIMPVTPDEDWINALGDNWKNTHKEYLNTVGNLTIISPRSNYAMSNASFLEKRDGPEGYKSSRFMLNAELCRQERWTEDEIRARAESLYEKAVKIWRYPAVDQAMLVKYMEKKGREPDEDEDEDEDEGHRKNWEQRLENSTPRVQDRVNQVIALLKQKFDCIKGSKSKYLYVCTSEPLESKTAFVVLECGVGTARMTFRINPDTFVENEDVTKRKNWFFNKGEERSIKLLDASDEELIEHAEHAYNATKTYLGKRA